MLRQALAGSHMQCCSSTAVRQVSLQSVQTASSMNLAASKMNNYSPVLPRIAQNVIESQTFQPGGQNGRSCEEASTPANQQV